ncbi:hypothetical protein L1987_10848 [Smallanthus sonchifolius]|uniref:Uncharacterized protein n=1 Tax=Smallanthus sonchifolius TaxID=185202 RepID=A0ACB9JBE9_9ASTR|nr:hypothetical protein L1987_10848 [Smallanthus sonchifolius]
MGGGATNQPPQDSQLAPATTEEEEFLKRNTDCVYFLASPLTCKKGSECEYRHSDIARVNPRDCWYWLNGNCLNPKCGFRHPPLDGLLEAEVPTPVGPAVPQAPVKQGVACIFFQKGFCLKGHLCPFWHGPPNIVNNIAVHPVPPNFVTKPSKVASAGPEKPVQEQKFTQQENVQKPTEFPPQGKQVPRVQPRNGGTGGGVVAVKKVAPPPEEPPRYKPANVVPPPVMNGLLPSRSNHGVYETNHVSDSEGINGKDVEEYSREPTPGFDVLVDNEPGDSEYYPNEEQFGRSRGRDFDMDRSVDYDVDRDMYHDQRDFDHYNKEGYAWEDHRENSSFGRTRYPRDESPDHFEWSDLRHRLSKQRRGNNVGGLRSVISREHPRGNHTDRMPRRDDRPDHRYDRCLDSGSLSSRLQGRIKIPGRSMSPGYENGSRVEREIDMGRQQRSRYSPGRAPHVSSNNSRFRDRIKIRSNDDGQTLGKRKYPRTESQQSEDKLSFEGPKPLSEILKRKRGSVISSVNNEDNNSNKNNEINQKEIKETPSGYTVNADHEKSTDGQTSLNHEASNVENKVGSIDEDAMLDQELEAYDHRDGDYDYEQIDGEDYNLEEGEEYMEEGDETGKKESEVYS